MEGEEKGFPTGIAGQRRLQAGYCLSFVSISLAFGVVGPTIPLYEAVTGQPTAVVGWLLAARGLGDALGTFSVPLLLGRGMSERHRVPPHLVMTLAMLLMALTAAVNALLTPLTGSFALVLVLSLLTGMASGVVDVGCSTLVPFVWEPSRLNLYMNMLHFIWGVGAGLSPQLVDLAYLLSDSPTYDLYYSQLFVSLGGFATAFFLVSCPSPLIHPPPPSIGDGDPNVDHRPLLIGGSDHHSSSFGSSSPVCVKVAAEEQQQQEEHEGYEVEKAPHGELEDKSTAVMRWLVKRKDQAILGSLSVFMFVYIGVELGFSAWITRYGLDVGMEKELATTLTTVFWWSLTLGRGVATGCAVSASPKQLLLADSALCFLAIACLYFFTGSIALFLTTALLGLGCASIFPGALALAPTLGVTMTASSTTVIVGGAALGNLAIPPLIGILLDTWGPSMLPVAIFPLMLAATSVLLAILSFHASLPPQFQSTPIPHVEL